MKRNSLFGCILAVTLCLIGCSKYDDSELKNSIDNVEDRLELLEAWQLTVEDELDALQTITDALDANDYVTDIVAVYIDEELVGYEVTFADYGTIKVPNGINEDDSIFMEDGVDNSNDSYVILTLTDGTTITLPKTNLITIGFTQYEDVIIDPFHYGLDLVLPATLKESDYTAIVAEVNIAGVTLTSVATKSDEYVSIITPTFTGGVYDQNARIDLILAQESGLLDMSGVLSVRLICSDGQEKRSTVTFTIKNPNIESTAGDLEELMAEKYEDKVDLIPTLIVTGELNSDDFAQFRSMSSLSTLDLSGSTVVGPIYTARYYDDTAGYTYDTQEGDALPIWAFESANIKSVTLPDGLTTIGNSAFYNCVNLTTVSIPEGVTTIGNYAFQSCSALKSIDIPASVTTLGDSAFLVYDFTSYNYYSVLESVTFGAGSKLEYIGAYAFAGTNIKSIDIPASVETVGMSVFSMCTSLQSVEFDPKCLVSTITEEMFYSCSSLSNVQLPDSLKEIQRAAFSTCTSLDDIMLPEKLETIGATAFMRSGLETIIIPASVTSIGGAAFEQCKSFVSLTALPLTPPTKPSGLSIINNTGTSVILYVPVVAVDTYKNNATWAGYGFSQVIGL